MNLWEQAKRIPNGVTALVEMLGEDGECAPQSLADARAKMCFVCTKREPSNMVFGKAAEVLKRFLEFKKDLKLEIENESELGSCGVCKCELRIKCWEPISLVKKKMTTEDFENFAVPCWQRDELP